MLNNHLKEISFFHKKRKKDRLKKLEDLDVLIKYSNDIKVVYKTTDEVNPGKRT